MSIWYVVIFSIIYINSECKNSQIFTHSNVYNNHINDVRNNLLNVQHHKQYPIDTHLIKYNDDEDESNSNDDEDDSSSHDDEDDDDDESNSNELKSDESVNESVNERDKVSSVKDENKDQPRVCGQGERSLLMYQQEDYGIALMGLIDKGVFKLYAGNVIVKEISMWDMISPIEMVNNKCFSIRRTSQLPVVLCTGGIDSRNRWVNALESARLCLITKIKHYLPNSIDHDFIEPEDSPPSGINIFVAESQFGKPEIVINGQTLEQIKKAEIDDISKNSYESTKWNTESHDLQDEDIMTDEYKESLAEAEMKRERAPESGHSRMF